MDDRSKDKHDAGGNQLERFESLRSRWTNCADDSTARKLLKTYRSLLAEFARKWTNGEDYDDLYQIASLSLLKAVKQFDPSRNTRFETYARLLISSAIKDYINRFRYLIDISRTDREDLRYLREAALELEKQHEHAPTVAQLSEFTGIDESRIHRVKEFEWAVTLISLNELQDLDDDSSEYLNSLESKSELGLESLELRLDLDPILNALKEFPRSIIKLRYGLEGDCMTQEAIGALFGKSQQAIQKAESVARKSLRANSESQILAEYLLGRFSDALSLNEEDGIAPSESKQGQTVKKTLFMYTLRWVRRNHNARVIKKLLTIRLKSLPTWMHLAFEDAYGRASPNETAIWIIENLIAKRFLRRTANNREFVLTPEGAGWLQRETGYSFMSLVS